MKITTNNSKIILGKNNTISPWAALQIITYNPPGKESHGTVTVSYTHLTLPTNREV